MSISAELVHGFQDFEQDALESYCQHLVQFFATMLLWLLRDLNSLIMILDHKIVVALV